ncbi:MAG: M28 family peptidase [Gemmatimonadales bacterium]|nr:M28 family peptidase [Gemmatimonadales bacterium]
MLRPLSAAVCWSITVAAAARAQTLPILDSTRTQLITQEISGDAAYAHIRFMSQFHRPRGGDNNLWMVGEYYERKAKEYGLTDVKLIKQPSTTRPWNPKFADLWIDGAAPERIASTLQSAAHLADYSRPTDTTAELIDIGTGTAAELEGKAVSGKIVLSTGNLTNVMTEAVIRRGALGVVWYSNPYNGPNGIDGSGLSRPDQIRWLSLSATPIEGKEPTFAFVLSARQGVGLKNRLAAAPGPIRVRALVQSEFTSIHGAEPWQVMVEAFIRGSDPGARQDIVLTGHMQEGPTQANDDASGTASVLEIGRALTRLIGEGKLPRPKRNIRFWWTTEIGSERQYFADHPEETGTIWVNVNQDMVGADQSQDIGRTQNVTRVPAARFHFLNDVMESVLEYLVAGNTFELAQYQAGHLLYPKPIISRLGSMFRYNAKPIWNHDQTDHMTFNETPVGIPGVSFTNMPDRFIHSSDDDLWNVDRTQLQRNAVAAALIAYIMATADSTAAPALLAETSGRGAERMGRNLRLGLGWIATLADRERAYAMAVDQIRYASGRERQAVRSIGQIGGGSGAAAAAVALEIDRREAQALRELELAYRQASGRQTVPKYLLGPAEAELQALRPAVTGGPKEFLAGRSQIATVPGLHPFMAPQILNAIDGRRTGLDIFRLVAAEAREAGDHYYGVVTAERVLQYLSNAEAQRLVRLR